MAPILVTGVGGFIGAHITAVLVAAGDEVVALDMGDAAAHRGPGPELVAGLAPDGGADVHHPPDP